MRAKIILLLVIVGLGLMASAQQLIFEHLSEQNGLVQTNITALAQDKNGFVWVGTENGIFRYDGYDFEKTVETDEINQSNFHILDIHADRTKISFITKNKLAVINNPSLNQRIYSIPENKLQKPKLVFSLNKEILIGCENGLFSLDIASGTYSNTKIAEPITGIKQLKSGKLIISTPEGFYFYYPFNKVIAAVNYRPNSYIKHLLVLDEHTISWIEGDGYFKQGRINQFVITPERNLFLTQIAGSTSFTKFQDYYYLGLEKGILQFDSNGKESIIQHKEEDYRSLSNNYISSLMPDINGNLWVGTKLGGLNLYQPFKHKFGLVSPLISSRYAKCNEILCFAEVPDGRILIQNKTGGLGIFDPKTDSIKKWIPTGINGNCLVQNVNDPNRYLIGCSEGLFEFFLKEEKLAFLSTKNGKYNFEFDIKCILPYAKNQYWMGGDKGLLLFDGNTKQVLATYGIGNSQIGSENIRSLYLKSEKEIYLGTSEGLYLFNMSKHSFQLVKLGSKIKQPFVTSVQLDSQKNIWVGTAGDGIYIKYRDGKVVNLNRTGILKNNYIKSLIFCEANQKIWASTNEGLSMIDSKKLTATNYQIYDGLQGAVFNESSALVTKNQTVYFGGVNGFNFFNPSKISIDTNNCRIQIKSFSVFNQKLPYAEYYNIPLQKNYLSIEFTALDYYINGDHSYQYKLDGLMKDWTEVGNRRFASFGELRPDDYIFRVRAKNPDGKLTNQEALLYFSIIPPFYQTWWFKVGLALLISSTIAWVIYSRIQSALKDEQEKGKQSRIIAELELKALRAQMNPHFIFNSLNSIQDFVLNNEGQLAAKYLSKFARLIRMILDISEQPFVNIQMKIEFLRLYVELELLRLNNTIVFSLNVDPQIEQDALIPALLIQPHVENAIWHGLQYKIGERKLSLTLSKSGESSIEVVVEDNGIGRKAALEIKKNKSIYYVSKGARITEERIQTLNRYYGSKPKIEIIDLYDENYLACGTKVIMHIPILYGK